MNPPRKLAKPCQTPSNPHNINPKPQPVILNPRLKLSHLAFVCLHKVWRTYPGPKGIVLLCGGEAQGFGVHCLCNPMPPGTLLLGPQGVYGPNYKVLGSIGKGIERSGELHRTTTSAMGRKLQGLGFRVYRGLGLGVAWGFSVEGMGV